MLRMSLFHGVVLDRILQNGFLVRQASLETQHCSLLFFFKLLYRREIQRWKMRSDVNIWEDSSPSPPRERTDSVDIIKSRSYSTER